METAEGKKESLIRSAGVVSAATFLSRVLGLIREQVTAYLFGASDAVDAFKSAFRIPNLLRDMFAEGALSAGFVPIFSEKLRIEGKEGALRFAGLVFGALTAILAVVVLLLMAIAPQIAFLIAGGFEEIPQKLERTILLARIMMPFLMLVSMAALMMGVLNSFGKFGVPALAPALLNVGMIVAAVALTPFVDPPVLSLAIGVLIGGAAQFLIQYFVLRKMGFRLHLVFDLFHPDLLRLLLLILPMTIGLAANQINVAVINRIASNDPGAVSYLDYAFRLIHLPLGLFAVAIATVSLPRLAGEAAGGNSIEFSRLHSDALRLGFFLSIPATMLTIILSREICAAVYQYGKFNSADSVETAKALAMYGVGLPFFTLVRITVPAFYAMKNTRTPALISLISVAANILLCFQFESRYGFAGLALAASIAGGVNLFLLIYLLRRTVRIAGDRENLIVLAKIALATLIAAAALLAVKRFAYSNILTPGAGNPLALLMFVGVAGIVFVAACKALRLHEMTRAIQIVKRRFKRQ